MSILPHEVKLWLFCL